MPPPDLKSLKPKDPEQLRAVSDISDTVHQEILKMAAISGVCLLAAFALHPFKKHGEWPKGCWAGALSGAWIVSCTAAGAGLWAAVRIRRRYVVWAATISVALATVSTAYAYLVTFGGF